ncbi:hypothetical protein, partial [Corynebacterium sp.]|uniref:hypothetical protein n=1 Tax=Corynebacterium sp. TaxID=1720 RepID=UPI001DBA5652
RDGPHGPLHPGQIFLAYSRFSHLLKRNKTWDTSVSVADVSASTIPVEKGYLELEDDKNVENFVDCREIRTVFKPTWVSWWFHKIFTFPRVECDGIVSNCHWGRDKTLVKDGGTVTVGFSYRIFHDTKIRCKSSPIEVSPSHAELEAKTAIINNSPMTAVLY